MPFVRVNTGFTNTITEVSDSAIVGLQPDEFEASVVFFFPPSQPPYFYRYNDITFEVEINSQSVINDYELFLDPLSAVSEAIDEAVLDLLTQTGQTQQQITDLFTFSGDTEQNLSDQEAAFTGFTAQTAIDLVELREFAQSLSAATSGTSSIVQALRTTALTNVPTSWVDFEYDTTLTESNPDIINHDDSNRDRFFVFESGLYQYYYNCETEDITDFRVRKNDTDVLFGSITESIYTKEVVVSKSGVVELEAGDFLTLQVQGNQSGKQIFANATFFVFKLSGIRGEAGDDGVTPNIDPVTKRWFIDGVDTGIVAEGQDGATGAGSNIIVRDEGVVVSGSPFDTLDITGATITNDGSTAKILIEAAAPPPAPICQLIDSAGGQALNNVSPNPIEWGTQDIIDNSVFSHTGGQSSITVLQDGDYEISYNVNGLGGNNRSIVGTQFRLNGSVIDATLSATYVRNNSNNDANNSIPPFTINLSNGDVLDVVAFRLGDSTGVSSKANSSFVKIKYLG